MGIVGIHPGSFRKSGKQRSYGIRNLEECTENGSCFVRSARHESTAMGRRIVKRLEGPRGGRAWLAGRARIAPTERNHHSTLVQFVNDYFK
jgi:hypothetical protein